MEVKDFNTYKDILVRCYKHQESLEEVLSNKSVLAFTTLRQAQELHRRNEELIEHIYSTIRGNTENTANDEQVSADIVTLFDK